MNCPTCDGILSQTSIEGIDLDVCKDGCGGIWFDRFELQKMDEPHEFTDANLIDILSVDSRKTPDPSKKYNCPKCLDVVMMRNFWSVKKEIEVDHCPKCAGYWLDEGELFKIRQQFKTEEERKRVEQDYFSELFGDEILSIKQENQEKSEQARKLANMLRLISPRYYFSKVKGE